AAGGGEFAPDRFLRARPPQERPTNARGASCTLDRRGASCPESRTVPGVFLHAAGVEAVATGRIVTTAPSLSMAAFAALLAVGGAWLRFAPSPPWGAVAPFRLPATPLPPTRAPLRAGAWR